MVIEYIRYAIPAERAEEFRAAYRRAGEALEASEHCLGYELSRGVEEPQNWVLRIRWDSLQGHERGFRVGPDFGPFFDAVQPFFDDIHEMKHYEATDVVSAS